MKDRTPTKDQPLRERLSLASVLGPTRLIFSGFGYLVLYRIAANRDGIESLGAWSVIIALVTTIGLGEMGFARVLTRAVSTHVVGGGNATRIRRLFREIFTIQSIFVFLPALIIIFFADQVSQYLGLSAKQAHSMALQLTVTGVGLRMYSTLFSSVTAGLGVIHYALIIELFSTIMNFSAAFALLIFSPLDALSSFACGHLGGSLVSFVANLYLANRLAPGTISVVPCFRFVEIPSVLKESMGFAGVTFAGLIRNSVLPLFISKFFGLDAAGILEVAYRPFAQLSNAGTSAFVPLLPHFARREKEGDLLTSTRTTILFFTSSLALTSFAAIGIATAYNDITLLWIGKHVERVQLFASLMAVYFVVGTLNGLCSQILQGIGLAVFSAKAAFLHLLLFLFGSVLFVVNDGNVSGVVGVYAFASIPSLFIQLRKILQRMRMGASLILKPSLGVLLGALFLILVLHIVITAIPTPSLFRLFLMTIISLGWLTLVLFRLIRAAGHKPYGLKEQPFRLS